MRSSNLFLALSAALLANCPSVAADLLVPSQYPTIQSAVTAAVNGDRVLVSPGIYPEMINLGGKRIRLESIEGPASTLIDRGSVGGGGWLVTAASTESLETVVKGFTLRAAHRGVVVQNSSLRLENCIIQAVTQHAVFAESADVQLVSCQIVGNTAVDREREGIGINATNSTIVVDGCAVTDNRTEGTIYVFSSQGYVNASYRRKGGAVRLNASTFMATGTSFVGNTVFGISDFDDSVHNPSVGGAIAAQGGLVDLAGCRFESNRVQSYGHCNYGLPGTGCAPWTATARGGAISIQGGGLLVVRPGCEFVDNSISNGGNVGVRVGRGSAISIDGASGPHSISGAVFRGNRFETPQVGSGLDIVTRGPTSLTITQSSFERINPAPTNATSSVAIEGGGSLFATGCTFSSSHFAVDTIATGGIVQQCLFRNVASGCVSATSQVTVRNNEVCNPPPQPYHGSIVDGGGNFTRPVCLGSDCNGNGQEDSYDISTGGSSDCNSNGVPDECELASGAESDCNADEILDSCQLRVASLESPSLGPVNYPTVLTHTFQNVARSGASVSIVFTAVADLDSPLEYLTPRLNSTTLSRLWESDGYNCPAESTATVTFTASQFNEILGSGTSLQVAFTPSIAVSSAAPCGNSFVRVRLDYQPISAIDCDGNGAIDLCEILSGSGSDANNNDVLDVCEQGGCSAADFNGNGIVDGADLAVVLAAWGPCAGSSCAADLNGDGSVNGFDLSALLAAWGPCAP